MDARGWCSLHYGRWRHNGDPLVCHNLRGIPFEERFWMRVDQSDPDGCWEWQGGRSNRGGYGLVGVGKAKNAKAHRIAYELANGPFDSDLFVCHRCDNPPCCRPDHLFLGTNADNAADRERKGRNRPGPAVAASAQVRRQRPTCKHGHPWTDENTRINRDGGRACRACARENSRRYRSRRS